ncbi:MAG: hypothetical protein ABIU87_04070, partial [Ornithinibacter sp.]
QEVHAERSANDPPALTRTRFTELLDIVTGRISDEHPDDDDREMAGLERDWAAYQLSEHHDTAACDDADLHDQIWTPDLTEELEHLASLDRAS